MKAGFIPVRKKGKLPWRTRSVTYELEYGSDMLQMHEDAISPGDKVLIIDDLLATGGTVKAVAELVRQFGGKIAGIGFLIELSFLKGREKLKEFPIVSLVKYQ
jgi:adenine phosphoribosyltransferase